MQSFFLLLAQAADGKADPQAAPGLPWWLPLVGIAVLFYFVMLRPMRRQEAERQALIGALKKNDKVVTSSGIIAVVSGIKDNEVSLKIDENSPVRIKVTKASIAQILKTTDDGDKEKDKEKEKEDKEKDSKEED